MAGEETGDVVRGERFSGGPARGFLSSLAEDHRLFEADLAVDRAHVVMLAERDIIDGDVAATILGALDTVEAAGFDGLPAGEDVHAAIETAVIDRAGPDGGRMHTARSRNDEVAACLRYRLRSDVLDAIEASLALREALADAAGGHEGTLLPGYTHLQPAQPTTVAHWLASYEGAVRRDTHRLFDAYGRINRSPLGAAAFAGTPFPVDRERVADLLGFDGLVENSTDAVSTRDFMLETAAAAATLSVTLSGVAEDLILFANRGLVELDDDYASTSSIMPQKKNPDTMELVRAAAGDATGGVAGLLTTLKGLPRAYNRDLQGASPHVWAAIDALTEAAAVTAGAVRTVSWNEADCVAAAAEGFATATGVADRLAMAGVPFRTAHEIVARAAERGGDLEAIDDAMQAILGDPLDDLVEPAVIEAALDPAQSVASRDSVGGPAPAAIADQLDGAAAALTDDREVLSDRRRSLGAAADRLERGVAAIG